MANITMKKAIIDAENHQSLAVIKAQEDQSVQLITATALKSQAEIRAEKEADIILADAKAYAEAIHIKTDNHCEN